MRKGVVVAVALVVVAVAALTLAAEEKSGKLARVEPETA